MVGLALYGSVYKALLELCSPTEGCKTGESPWIPINHRSGKFIKRAFLIVRVIKAAYKTDTMRKLLIGQVSGTVQGMSEDQKNCFNGYCNIGNRVTVNTTAGDHFDVTFSSPNTAEGKFDCFAIIEKTDKYLQSLIPEFKAAYGTDVCRNVFCPNKEVTRREIQGGSGNDIARRYEPAGHVMVYLGNEKQNVGDLTGAALYDSIYHALDSLCPPGSQACKKFLEVYQIPVRAFDGQSAFPGLLSISVDCGEYESDVVRRLLIGQVAGVLQKSSEDDKNCYYYNWHGVMGNKGCNVGNFVSISNGSNQLIVKIASPTDVGAFDCVAIFEETDEYLQSLIPEFSTAAGGPVTREIYCLGKEVS